MRVCAVLVEALVHLQIHGQYESFGDPFSSYYVGQNLCFVIEVESACVVCWLDRRQLLVRAPSHGYIVRFLEWSGFWNFSISATMKKSLKL